MTYTDLSYEEARRRLNYDPNTGIVTWKERPHTGAGRCKVGGEAGSYHKHSGYRTLCIRGKTFFMHRVIYLWMTGSYPDNSLDHINGVKDDNRWCNLRPCVQAQNMANMKIRKNNKTGYKGVVKRPNQEKYRARVCLGRNRINLGDFNTPEEAHEAYKAAAVKYFGEFANFG